MNPASIENVLFHLSSFCGGNKMVVSIQLGLT